MSDIDVDKYVKENSCNFGLLAIPENCHGMRFKYLSIKKNSYLPTGKQLQSIVKKPLVGLSEKS